MTIGLGIYNPMPMQLGGGDSILEVEHNAILDELGKGELGFDVSEDTEIYWEAYGDAVASFMFWRMNQRLSAQGQPKTMMENLPVWEEATETRPGPNDTGFDRRVRLDAKLRGIANNALPDIEQAAERILGDNFDALLLVDSVDWVVYWPGVNPGPPGFEWTSNRARVCIRATNSNLSQEQLDLKRSALVNQLDAMLPAWVSFCVGTGTSFVCNVGIIGETLL